MLDLVGGEVLGDFVKNTGLHLVFLQGHGLFLDVHALIHSSLTEDILFNRAIHIQVLQALRIGA